MIQRAAAVLLLWLVGFGRRCQLRYNTSGLLLVCRVLTYKLPSLKSIHTVAIAHTASFNVGSPSQRIFYEVDVCTRI